MGVRAQQTLFTCDRCGTKITGPLRSRKMPDGWIRTDLPFFDGGEVTLVAADLCGPCVGSYLQWWNTVEPRQITQQREG